MNITLTFDNGPDPVVTPYVLDVLRERSLLATFFVLGSCIADPALRRLSERAVAEGHRIGNHTYSHRHPFGTPEGAPGAVEEVRRTQALIGDLAGPRRLFRPFGGGGIIDEALFSRRSFEFLCRESYDVALWSCVPRDWEDTAGWPERALELLEEDTDNVVVLHDLPTGAMRQLPRFLDMLAARRVRMVQDIPDGALIVKAGRPTGSFAHAVPRP